MATIPLTITGIREAQQQLEDLGKEFDKFKKDPIKSKKLAKEFNDLSKDIDKATASLDEMNKSGKNLSATFEEIYGEDLKPMTGRIGELEDRLYELALAGAENTEEFAQMSAEVVRLKTTIRETDKQIDLMTESKGLAVFGEGFSQIGASLLRLDFTTAGRDAEALNNAVGNLSKIGQQAFTGLAKTVGQLTKAFIKMGIALMANPIFWIAVAIGVVIGLFIKLADSLGFLQPILDGIAYAFGLIKDAIDVVVQGLKDFLDWIGLTDFAGEESARKAQENAEKKMKVAEEQGAQRQRLYDREIKLLNAEGKDTTKAELKKQYAIINTAKTRRDAIKAQIEANKKTNKLTEEEVQKLKDSLKETTIAIADSVNEVKVIRANANKEQAKKNKEERAINKANYEKMLADRKQYEKDRLDAMRRIKDLELDLLEDGLEKELEKLREKLKREIEDVESNEKLKSEEKIRLKALLAEQELQAELELIEKDENARIKKEQEMEKKRQDELAKIKADADAKFAEDEAKRLADEEAYNDARLEADRALFDAKLGAGKGFVSALSTLAGENEKAQNAFFLVDKALAIGEVIVNTQREIAGYFASYSLIPGGAAIAASQAVGAKIRAATSIATILATSIAKFKNGGAGASAGGGASVGGGGSAGATATQQATPSFELFGQNNNANNLSSPEDVETSNQITVKAVVSETEVTETQNKIKKITESASL
jgi:hypothetical protein